MASAHEEEVLGKAYDSRLMKRLLRYLAPYKWQVAIALGSIFLKVGADVLGPYLTKIVIDRYLAPVPGLHTRFDRFLSSNPFAGIAQIAALYVGLLVFSFLLEYLQTYYMQWAGQMVMFDLRKEIFRHLQRMHIGFYDRNPVGRLVTRVTSDVDALNEMFTSGVVSIFEDVFVLAGIVAIMLHMNPKLALITFAVLPLIAIATKIFRDKVRDSYRRIRVAIARINAYLQEHVSGMVVLQLFNREQRAFAKFSDVNASHMDAFKDAIMAHAVYYPVVEILSSIAIACVIWFGGNDVIRGATTIGILAAFIQYAQRFFRPIQDFSEKYNILQSAMASSERIFKLLDTPVEITSPAVTKKPEGPGRIEFDHVWFAYRNIPIDTGDGKNGKGARAAEDRATHTTQPLLEPDWVLRDVSFVIEPGETVAIVGHTGAGKTTIISLLMRFYDVQKGAIKIDGVDVKDMDLADLRRRYGVVLQDPFLFTGTVEGNIRLGTQFITDEDVQQAAIDVNLAEFIRTLPQGFKEEVRERGSTLSTGQKQLISFARALAHNPKILILDEATSSVDTETEFKVRDALSRMVEGRTSVVIAHRLSTVQRADKIIVMHKGLVREEGTHQQLLAQRGIYYKLYQLQYKDQEIPVASGPEVTASADD
ncbi:MAG: antibiotic ABC transporter ATP-binding protein [Acidobacteria bacterium]|nr:MAG: antibiotic ABC transporter ATP-binding protein [Acidobacteriales bacterium 13_1_40CM_3_55_5]PYV99891.1 MAG: antibiotic ABC transporter ATP-binding protein [Acidobacteriota bacterium]